MNTKQQEGTMSEERITRLQIENGMEELRLKSETVAGMAWRVCMLLFGGEGKAPTTEEKRVTSPTGFLPETYWVIQATQRGLIAAQQALGELLDGLDQRAEPLMPDADQAATGTFQGPVPPNAWSRRLRDR